jgi:hypothetical protein
VKILSGRQSGQERVERDVEGAGRQHEAERLREGDDEGSQRDAPPDTTPRASVGLAGPDDQGKDDTADGDRLPRQGQPAEEYVEKRDYAVGLQRRLGSRAALV